MLAPGIATHSGKQLQVSILLQHGAYPNAALYSFKYAYADTKSTSLLLQYADKDVHLERAKNDAVSVNAALKRTTLVCARTTARRCGFRHAKNIDGT